MYRRCRICERVYYGNRWLGYYARVAPNELQPYNCTEKKEKHEWVEVFPSFVGFYQKEAFMKEEDFYVVRYARKR